MDDPTLTYIQVLLRQLGNWEREGGGDTEI